MEYYHYVNIFETKGLEYVLVIAFMITFIFFVMKLEAGSKAPDKLKYSAPNDGLSESIVVVADGEKPAPKSEGAEKNSTPTTADG